MKKIFLFLLSASLLLGSCAKEDSDVEIWTVASEKGVAGVQFGFGFVPANIIKRSETSRWEIFPDEIEGFTFEPGYECVLRVRIDPIPNPPADGSSRRYVVEQLLSRVAAHSVDCAEYSPVIDLLVASQRGSYYGFSCYWVKDLRYGDEAQWEPLPLDIQGFEFEPGYEYRLRLAVTAEQQTEGNYLAAFSLVEELSKQPADSEELPANS